MYFKDYINYPDAKINPMLLWEYNINEVDLKTMRNVVVQRVVERGWPNDWYAMFNLYGVDGVKEAIKELPYLNDKDMNFVIKLLDIPIASLKCYQKKHSNNANWDI